jgi:NAD(P)-dependent dehydrogenase (short-subunit alcohol dehydrogenase family)
MFETAIVTGGASGIGAAVVRLLEAEGVDVRVLDLASGFDVADPAAWGSVEGADFAFLNAGVGGESEDLEGYRRMVGANVDGVVFGVRRMEDAMGPGGTIVATASLAGLVPMPLDPVYTLTKHAVVGYVRAVAPSLAERALRINAVCPGFTETAIITPELRQWVAEQGIPMLDADDVARAVLHVARSEDTGQAWVVQPGREPVQYEFRGVPGPR